MKNFNIKTGIYFFSLFFLLESIFDLFTGYSIRSTGAYVEPISWSEYFSTIPKLMVFAFILTIVLLKIVQIGKATEKRDIENAHKRIEEREKIKKEKKSESSKKAN